MRIYLDLDTRKLMSSPIRVLSRLEFKRRDNDMIELQFLRDGQVQELAAGTITKIGVKADAVFNSDFLSIATLAKTGAGNSTVYSGELNFNTNEIATAFSAEPGTLAAMLEVEWITGSTISSSKTLPAIIYNDVIRGDEGEPATLPLFYTSATSDFKATQAEAEAGLDNEKWMTPLRTAQAIAKLQHTHSISDVTGLQAAIDGKVTGSGGITAIEIVSAMPASPNSSTLYIVTA